MNLYFVLHSKNDRRNRAVTGVANINNVGMRPTGYDPLICFLNHTSKRHSAFNLFSRQGWPPAVTESKAQ